MYYLANFGLKFYRLANFEGLRFRLIYSKWFLVYGPNLDLISHRFDCLVETLNYGTRMLSLVFIAC